MYDKPFSLIVISFFLFLVFFSFILFCLLFITACRVIARTMPWQDVCPSVRPSHAGIVSTLLYISSVFFTTILVLSYTKRGGNNPTETP